MVQYVRPTEQELPASLAEVMGWRLHRGPVVDCWTSVDGNSRTKYEWHPLTDRNHAHRAVQRCAELGLMYIDDSYFEDNYGDVDLDFNFVDCLMHEIGERVNIEWEEKQVAFLLLATPAQMSYAAHRVLWEHRNLLHNKNEST